LQGAQIAWALEAPQMVRLKLTQLQPASVRQVVLSVLAIHGTTYVLGVGAGLQPAGAHRQFAQLSPSQVWLVVCAEQASVHLEHVFVSVILVPGVQVVPAAQVIAVVGQAEVFCAPVVPKR